jgi:outer membrane receptor for ferric coprogen and ferric-rhodotorulic acid
LRLSAQTVTPPDQGQTKPAANVAIASADSDQVVVLSPFVVEAGSDKGYTATSTLAGTRVRTDLKDIASSISVVTEQFLKDTGATNNAELLVYTPSTEVAGLRGNYSGVAGTQFFSENTVSSTTRVRGLDSADNTRDYFLTDIPWDGFNVGRVDLQRGPNSILFGVGSPAGIINTSVNDASFKTAYRYEVRTDQYGSLRNVLDANQSIIPGLLAIRVSYLNDKELYEQKPAFNNQERKFVALRFDPKLFGEGSHTTIKLKYEEGTIDSNNPRSVPPVDAITPWFQTGTNQYGNPGYNKIILNQFSSSNMFDGIAYPGGNGGSTPLAAGLGLNNQGRSFWPDIINYYDATPGSTNGASATPIKTIAAQPNTALGITSAGVASQGLGGTLGAANGAFLPKAIPELSSYLVNVTNTSATNFANHKVPGAIYYSDVLLRDPGIFDFYRKLLDGPNKHEWQNWKAYNATFEQSFFNDRLAVQVSVDHQTYTQGQNAWMQGQNYEVTVDINATYADGSANPNAGRPYAGNGESAPGVNWQKTTTRDVFRVTPTYELRASDFLGDTTLAKILGKHDITATYETNQVVQSYATWAEFATTPDYPVSNSYNSPTVSSTAGSTLNSNRQFEWIAYIGPSMVNATSAKGLNLNNIGFTIAPPPNQVAFNFNAHWNQPTDPAAAGYVNPGAPFTYVNYTTDPLASGNVLNSSGQVVVNGHQSDNTANYVGWTQEPITWLSAKNPADFASLVEAADRTKFTDTSRGVVWQGYLFGGDLVPTFGWRKDVIANYQTNAKTDLYSGYTSLNFPDDPTSRSDVRGESKTWGIVYHLPKFLTSHLPWDSGISFFYDRGTNFKADASRLAMDGSTLPNANGKTLEYGINITTLRDKLTLKVAKFKTTVANATLNGTNQNSIAGLGANSYFIADGSIWGYGWAAYLQAAITPNGGDPTTAAGYGTHGTSMNTTGDYSNPDSVAVGAGGKGIYDSNATPDELAKRLSYDLNGGDNPSYTSNQAPVYKHFAGDIAVVNAWVNNPFPDTFFASYSLTPNIVTSVGKKSGILADSFVGGYGYSYWNAGGGSNFGNHQSTVTNQSKGTEVELSFQPTKNWNITANYTHTDATHQEVDPTSIAFMSSLTKFYNGPAGELRMWGNGGYNDGGTFLGDWNNSLVAPYATTMNQLGHAAPEVSPWRFNLVTTYTFDHGMLNGLFVGGGFRDEAGKILGYRYSSTVANPALTNDPSYANVTLLTEGGLDISQPFYGKSDYHVDGWVGYTRKLNRKVDWRIQVNVHSIGEHDHLQTAGMNPDGSITAASIQEGMGWQLTNSFEF